MSDPKLTTAGEAQPLMAVPSTELLSCGVESETCECCDGKGWYPWRVKGGKYGWYPWYEQHCKACNGTGRVAKRQPQDNMK